VAKVGGGGTASAAHWRHTAGQKAAVIHNHRKQGAARKRRLQLLSSVVTDCDLLMTSDLKSLGASHTGSIPVPGTRHSNA
jgi:hypothetical protein